MKKSYRAAAVRPSPSNMVSGEDALTPENRLLLAFEFAAEHKKEFIRFCKRNNLDCKKQYQQAIIKFYDAQHKQ